MATNIKKLEQAINALYKQKANVTRSAEHFKSDRNEQPLYRKFLEDLQEIDVKIGKTMDDLVKAEEAHKQLMREYQEANETSNEKLVRYINEGREDLSGDATKIDAINEVLDIVINALERLDQGY
jgi:primosomal protein N''